MYGFEAPEDGFMTIEDWRIQLWSKSEGPWATLTVSGPGMNPKENIFIIKNYSENYGVFSWMQKNGFIVEVLKMIFVGNGTMVTCKIDVDKVKNYGEVE